MEKQEIEIIYREKDFLICNKPAGIPCESADATAVTLASLIKEQLDRENGKSNYVGVVHRLDQITCGLILYSLSEKATGRLTELLADAASSKEYLAIVHGKPEFESGVMTDLLFRDVKKNKSYVVKRLRKGVKEAKLNYSVIASTESEYGDISLVSIRLITGRTHQIRVQFASRNMPLVGDGKYGGSDNGIGVCLFSHKLILPRNGKMQEFVQPCPICYPWSLFNIEQ